jgi:hypothetical protein
MSVFKYAKGSEPKDERVPEESAKTEEVKEERKDSKQPAPAERGTNTYEEGESDSASNPFSRIRGGSFPNRSQ